MDALLLLFFFILGTIIGSFLNAYTFRYNTGLSMISRSMCMSCSTTIEWYDLIPGISFLILGGKCRACNSRISFQYPLIEILTGVLFASIFWVIGLSIESILVTIIFSLLVAIIIYDIKHTIIPEHLVYWFILLSFSSIFVIGNTVSSVFFSIGPLITGAALFLFFFLIWFFSNGTWMGLGDAKLALGIGLFLGTVGGVSAVVLGFWIGALISLIILFVQKIKGFGSLTLKSEIPFAPFLIVGLWLVFFFNINLLSVGL